MQLFKYREFKFGFFIATFSAFALTQNRALAAV
ncbi:Uncharacterised protein [Vibrio cholerae]|nr:Uncharacterised protein [Vibrio cholerae]